MLEKLLNWVKEWIGKMIGQPELKNNLNVDIQVSQPMAEAIQTWSKMYINQSPWITADIKGLNLAAAVATEIARAVTIEMKVEVTGSKRAAWLQTQLEPVLDNIRQQVEYGIAKGGLIMKPFSDGENIHVDFVQADQFYPVSHNPSGKITACVFADQRTIGKYFYTRLEFHNQEGKKYTIRNQAFRSTTKDTLGNKIPLSQVPDWAELDEQVDIQNIKKPLFAHFRNPMPNNIDPTSPLGVSAYARAVLQIEQADKTWSQLLWELESGERAIYADQLAFTKTDDGTFRLPTKRLYRALDFGGSGDDLFKDWSPTIRETNILNALNAIMKKVEFNSGLAYGTLSDPNQVDKTATEIMSAKQRSAATITDTQKALQRAMDDLIEAMNAIADLEKLPGSGSGSYTTKYDFDDSLITDGAAQFTQDMQVVSSQIMSKVEFRMRNYKEDEATAKKMIAAVAAEQPKQDLFDEE